MCPSLHSLFTGFQNAKGYETSFPPFPTPVCLPFQLPKGGQQVAHRFLSLQYFTPTLAASISPSLSLGSLLCSQRLQPGVLVKKKKKMLMDLRFLRVT